MGFFSPGSRDARRKDVWALEDKLDALREDLAMERAEKELAEREEERDRAARLAEEGHALELAAALKRRDENLAWWRGRPAEK